MSESFVAQSQVWLWKPDKPGTAAWHFLPIDADTSAQIRFAAPFIGRFGSVKVTAQIGNTSWQTSMFPHRDTGGLLLPLKLDVRQRESLSDGDEVHVTLRV